MAKLKEGINGDMRGKLGNIIGYTSGNSNNLRSSAVNFKDAKSDKQLRVRDKLKAISCFAQKFIGYPCIASMAQKGKNNSSLASFIKLNYEAIGDNCEISDYSKLIFSSGRLAFPTNLKLDKIDNRKDSIKVSWNNNSLFLDSDADYLQKEYISFCLIEESALKDIRILNYKPLARRADESIIINIGELRKKEFNEGTLLHFYFYFTDKNQQIFSNSYHKEIVV